MKDYTLTRSKEHTRYANSRSGKSSVADVINKTQSTFEDPRKQKDRRVHDRPELIPAEGCRRRIERRSDRLNLGSWWMKRRYTNDPMGR